MTRRWLGKINSVLNHLFTVNVVAIDIAIDIRLTQYYALYWHREAHSQICTLSTFWDSVELGTSAKKAMVRPLKTTRSLFLWRNWFPIQPELWQVLIRYLYVYWFLLQLLRSTYLSVLGVEIVMQEIAILHYWVHWFALMPKCKVVLLYMCCWK